MTDLTSALAGKIADTINLHMDCGGSCDPPMRELIADELQPVQAVVEYNQTMSGELRRLREEARGGDGDTIIVTGYLLQAWAEMIDDKLPALEDSCRTK